MIYQHTEIRHHCEYSDKYDSSACKHHDAIVMPMTHDDDQSGIELHFQTKDSFHYHLPYHSLGQPRIGTKKL